MTEKYLFFRTSENEGAVKALRDLQYIYTTADAGDNDDLIFVFSNVSGTGEDQITIELANGSDHVIALHEFAVALNAPHSNGFITIADDHTKKYAFSNIKTPGDSCGSFG